jgi:GNAT superfamily N-acetyltransferase
MSVRLRPASAGDVEAIAGLHADSWRRSYRGALRDEYLDGDILPERLALWRERLTTPPADRGGRTATILAVDDGTDALLGFAHTIGDDDPEWGSLLDNLHVVHDQKRRGIGATLMGATAGWVRDHAAMPVLHLWVLDTNTGARRFYESLGAADVGGDVWEPPGGGRAPRRRYAWTALAPLLARR